VSTYSNPNVDKRLVRVFGTIKDDALAKLVRPLDARPTA